jgi:hypothetical protein
MKGSGDKKRIKGICLILLDKHVVYIYNGQITNDIE